MSIINQAECTVCGKLFKRTASWLCPKCREIYRRAKDQERKRRRNKTKVSQETLELLAKYTRPLEIEVESIPKKPHLKAQVTEDNAPRSVRQVGRFKVETRGQFAWGSSCKYNKSEK